MCCLTVVSIACLILMFLLMWWYSDVELDLGISDATPGSPAIIVKDVGEDEDEEMSAAIADVSEGEEETVYFSKVESSDVNEDEDEEMSPAIADVSEGEEETVYFSEVERSDVNEGEEMSPAITDVPEGEDEENDSISDEHQEVDADEGDSESGEFFDESEEYEEEDDDSDDYEGMEEELVAWIEHFREGYPEKDWRRIVSIIKYGRGSAEDMYTFLGNKVWDTNEYLQRMKDEQTRIEQEEEGLMAQLKEIGERLDSAAKKLIAAQEIKRPWYRSPCCWRKQKREKQMLIASFKADYLEYDEEMERVRKELEEKMAERLTVDKECWEAHQEFIGYQRAESDYYMALLILRTYHKQNVATREISRPML